MAEEVQGQAQQEPTENNVLVKQEEAAVSNSEKPNNSETVIEKPQAEVKKWKIKDGGQEYELDEQTLVTWANKAIGVDRRLREVSEKDKALGDFIRQVQTNPEIALKAAGHDPDAWIQKRLEEGYRRSMMTPEQKRLEELEAFQKQKLAEDEERKKAEAMTAEQKAQESVVLQLKAQIEGYIEQNDDLKELDRSWTIGFFANALNKARLAGKDLTADEIGSMVRATVRDQAVSNIMRYPKDKLIQFLGEDVVKKIREADLERYRVKKDAKPTGKKPVQRHNKPETIDEFLARVKAEARSALAT